MVGKIMIGKSFGGCIRYAVGKKDAVILDANGIRTDQLSHIIADFNMQRKSNPSLGMAVGHIALSWSSNDLNLLSDEKMVQITADYLQRMKIMDTQYLVVRHYDGSNPHLHLIYNRVNNEGKTIPDNFQKQRNATVCKELTLKHNFFMAQGKETVNRERLTGADKVKYQLYDAIKNASAKAANMDELQKLLAREGITLQYKYKSGTKEIQGISFSKGEFKFKGSEIDRSFSYANLTKAFEEKINVVKETQVQQTAQDAYQWEGEQWESDDPEYDDDEQEYEYPDEYANTGEKGQTQNNKPSLADQLRVAMQGIAITPDPEPKKKKKRGYGYGR
jgi:hypothetical protein